MKKLSIFALAALMMVACNNKQDEPTPDPTPAEISLHTSGLDLMAQGMSANHTYVVGQNTEYKAFFWNTASNEQKEFEIAGALYAVNNDGLAVGTQGEGEQFAITYKDGQITKLGVPEGAFGSAAYDLTDDGQTIVGFYYDATYATKPCYWDASGAIHDLPVPTEAEAGFEIAGAAVRWVSADGSVILGYLMDNFSTWPATIWNKQADGSYACDIICKDYFEDDCFKGKPYMTFGFGPNAMALSKNGEWIAFTVQEEYDAINWADPTPYWGARMNLKTKTLEICKNVPTLYSISNDGMAIGFDGESPTQRTAYVWLKGETEGKLLANHYELDGLKNLSSCSPMSIAPDASAACGFAVSNDSLYSFVIY